MKKTIFIITFILPLLFSAGIAFPNEESDVIIESEQRIEALQQENNHFLAEDSDSYIGRMIKNAEDVLAIALQIGDKCERHSMEDDSSLKCHDYSKVFTETSAIMKLEIAKYCVYKGLINTAKKIYTNIIITYGDAFYIPYVEQAKFGLGELK